jgi:hypothetical protein
MGVNVACQEVECKEEEKCSGNLGPGRSGYQFPVYALHFPVKFRDKMSKRVSLDVV